MSGSAAYSLRLVALRLKVSMHVSRTRAGSAKQLEAHDFNKIDEDGLVVVTIFVMRWVRRDQFCPVMRER